MSCSFAVGRWLWLRLLLRWLLRLGAGWPLDELEASDGFGASALLLLLQPVLDVLELDLVGRQLVAPASS
jgi:hypothetical protein